MTTIQKPRKIIARKEEIGSVTHVERGSVVTMDLAVGANGGLSSFSFSYENYLNITSFQMHLKEVSGQQINLNGWLSRIFRSSSDILNNIPDSLKRGLTYFFKTVIGLISTYQHWT
ncbi:hypothetical protein AVEN_14678-1 [Araneus ventricosus]|uniref:Uncharacterized protein n=1 Tax=Araneus ventricosus TaxID=182803 RepID=A0A4Y2TXV1_ARAVE|nr:hypothetical protein AVEN_85296-1 [Araneus ventricosus]GBO04177.1 hypothetical protein AVEN_14678-1 [Araneus ventricosus]